MKKLLCVLLCLVMPLASCIPAFASELPTVEGLIGRFSEYSGKAQTPSAEEPSVVTPVVSGGFDVSLFENDETYEISDSSSSDNRFIDIADWSPCFFDPMLSDQYYCVFAPDVLLYSDGTALFRLWSLFYSRENNYIDTAEISFAGYTYKIGDISSSSDRMDNDDIREQTIIVVGEELNGMMQNLLANRGAEVTVRLLGTTLDYSFVMEDSMKDTILAMYEKFVQAGGANPEYFASAYNHPIEITTPAGNVPAEVPAAEAPAAEVPSVYVPGFDMSLFGEKFEIDPPTETSHGYIDLADRDNILFDPNFSQDYYCCFGPDVQLRVDGNVQFRLWSYFYAKREFDLDTAIFTFSDATYTIRDIDSGSKELDNGDIREYLTINIGTQLSELIEKLRANINGTVSLELTGANGNYRFNMPTSMKQEIVDMYDLFLQAGGGSFMNSDTENRFTIN